MYGICIVANLAQCCSCYVGQECMISDEGGMVELTPSLWQADGRAYC